MDSYLCTCLDFFAQIVVEVLIFRAVTPIISVMKNHDSTPFSMGTVLTFDSLSIADNSIRYFVDLYRYHYTRRIQSHLESRVAPAS